MTQDLIKLQPREGGRHILVALDLSKHSWYALQFTIQNILRDADVLTIYNILNPKHLENTNGDEEHFRVESMKGIHDRIETFKTKHGREFQFRVHASWAGDVKSMIVEKATEKYSMVVVGSRGVSNLKGVFVGSVSNYVLQNAKIPVVVLHKPSPDTVVEIVGVDYVVPTGPFSRKEPQLIL